MRSSITALLFTLALGVGAHAAEEDQPALSVQLDSGVVSYQAPRMLSTFEEMWRCTSMGCLSKVKEADLAKGLLKLRGAQRVGPSRRAARLTQAEATRFAKALKRAAAAQPARARLTARSLRQLGRIDARPPRR